MAATALAVQVAPKTGLLVVKSTPTQTTGHSAPVGDDITLTVYNASGGTITADVHVTKTGPGGLPVATPAGAAAASRRVSCAVGDTQIPLSSDYDRGDGMCTFDLSAFASTTLACTRPGS
jgi:hypothetical protein